MTDQRCDMNSVRPEVILRMLSALKRVRVKPTNSERVLVATMIVAKSLDLAAAVGELSAIDCDLDDVISPEEIFSSAVSAIVRNAAKRKKDLEYERRANEALKSRKAHLRIVLGGVR